MTNLMAPAIRTHPVSHHVRHYIGMLVAMVVGMMVLAPFWSPDRVDLAAGWMATTMAAGMAVWMWHRGHSGASIAEMTAAMYLPFLVLLIPWWAGLVSGEAVLIGGHVLMLPAMVVPLLRHPGHGAPRTHGLLSRWPTVLALLCTVDNMIRPTSMSAWTLLVLPLGYLAIGTFRRTLRPYLRLELAGLAGYLLLIVAALLWGPLFVGIGWLAHAGWDFWHHRRDAVVPKVFSEWCGVLDLVIGVSVIVFALTR